MKTLTIPNDVLIPEIGRILESGHTATLRVKGVSMRPFLEDGRDKVLLEPVGNNCLNIGDVVLANVGDRRYVLHRICKIEGDILILRGDGNAFGKEQCGRMDIIGKATAFYRKGREKPDSVDKWKWKLYSCLWPSSPFLRRIFLGLYRRVWLMSMRQY